MLQHKKKQKSKPRGIGYIRESTDDQDKGFSPERQERSIKDYAERYNIQIVDWYKDLISGTSTIKRDDFKRMMKDAEAGKFDVIIVYHTSRFARSVEDARKHKKLLREKLGIDVVSSTQHFGEWNKPDAFLNEGINELFDEYYSKQLSFWVRGALEEKRQQGYQRGNPPFGYYKKKIGFDKEKNKPIYERQWLIHPKESKAVKRLYKLYTTSKYSYQDLAKLMREEGIKTKYGNPFTYSSIKDILNNRVYLGYVVSPRKKDLEDIKTSKHPTIISKQLFEKVQVVIAQRTKAIGRPVAQHRLYLLQGLVYCYQCIKYLKGKENKRDAKLVPRMFCYTQKWRDSKGKTRERYYYRCKLEREMKACNQPHVPCEIIDKQVIKLMGSLELPDDIIKMTLEKLARMFDTVSKSQKEQNRVKELEAQKKKLTTIYEHTDRYSEDEFVEKMKDIEAQLTAYKKLGLTEQKKGVTKRVAIRETEKFLKDFKKFWNKLDTEEQKNWIQMTIKRIWVKNRKVVGIEPHDNFKPLFSALKLVSGQARSDTLTSVILVYQLVFQQLNFQI